MHDVHTIILNDTLTNPASAHFNSRITSYRRLKLNIPYCF